MTTKDRPTPFMDEMVRALLREVDPKTQTRRVVKLPDAPNHLGVWEPTTIGGAGVTNPDGSPAVERAAIWHTRTGQTITAPLGGPGDRLWVKETHNTDWCDHTIYRADGGSARDAGYESVPKWKPPMFMFRKHSRILLEITDVWCQRVQEISEEDARAEGVERYSHTGDGRFYDNAYRAGFQILWNSINAKPKPLYSAKKIVAYRSFPWDDVQETRTHRGKPWYVHGNPHVFAYSFKRLEP